MSAKMVLTILLIEGIQFTIQFHVDDLNLSHVSQDDIDDIIGALNAI